MKRLDRNISFMAVALAQAARSTCRRRSVGCVLVDRQGRIAATGFNGVAREERHCIDEPCLGAGLKSGEGLDLCMAIHAEQNAIAHCKDTMEIDEVYVTSFPCAHCLKMIMNTSATTIFFMDDYPNALKGHGLLAVKLEDSILYTIKELYDAERERSDPVDQDTPMVPAEGLTGSEWRERLGFGHGDLRPKAEG